VSAAVAVALRELRERRLLLALGAGGLALVGALSWLPRTPTLRMATTVLATVLVFALPLAVALSVGASIVARDAADGRLRFYLARPITALALWAGKAAAAGTLVAFPVVCGVLAARVSEGGPLSRFLPVSIGALLGSCFLMAVAHVASTGYRSRSRWPIVDLGAVALALIGLAWLGRALALAGAAQPLLMYALPAVIGCAALAVLAGAFAQLAIGRADVVRGHRALSLTVWPLAAAVLAGVWGFGAWLRSTSPARLGVERPLIAAPAGAGVFVSSAGWEGRLGYAPVFVMNGDSGAWTPFAGDRFTPPSFNARGTRAAWVAGPPAHGELRWPGWTSFALATARFEGAVPVVEETPLVGDGWGFVLALDPAGARAAVQRSSQVIVLDTTSGGEVVRIPVDARAAVFRDDGSLRVWAQEGASPGGAAVVLDCDVAHGTRIERARVPTRVALEGVEPADLRGEVAMLSIGKDRVLLDVQQSASYTLPSQATASRVLADGTVALALPGEVRVVDRAGQTLRSFAAGHGRLDRIEEVYPGQLAVQYFDHMRWPWWRTEILDATTGKLLRDGLGLTLAVSAEARDPLAGSPGARLLMRNGGLSCLQANGTLRVLVPEQE
jgi:hypothetical protein